MRSFKPGIACLLILLLSSLSSPTGAQGQSTADILAELGGYPCPNSDFTCVAVSVPLDHFAPSEDETIEVIFGVLPAWGQRKGMFVTVTGGPGTSGLAAADYYTAAFDPSITEYFDIVFFDQRGAAQSGGLQCPVATLAYFQADLRAATPEQEAHVIEVSRTFAEDCVAEMGLPPEQLAYYGTRQAVEDLERFRQLIGDEKIWLYGESYGTQYAQQYATAHPDHVAGLILDGTVDLTLPIQDYLIEQAQAFNDVVMATLESCNADEWCSADVEGGDAVAVFDDLAAELATAPITYEFPLPGGETAQRTFTLSDLEVAAAGYAYTETSRMMFQRAIAAASHGSILPLARIAYSELGLDPVTLEAIIDPTYSDAMYFAVECNDYDYFSGTPEERAEAYMRAGDVVDESNPRFASLFYAEVPCIFWPGAPVTERPTPFTGEGIPTFVLGATADPATPVENGERVFQHLDNGYLVTTQGGAHVIFGRGNACPDDLITAFLVNDELPDEREIICEGVIASDYLPNAPADASAFADPLEAMDSAYTEIYYLPEYYYWDQVTPQSVGCPYGGTLSYEPTDTGSNITLDNCAFSDGFVMTGRGFDNYYGDGSAELDVSVTGLADGALIYHYDGEGNLSATGTYGGEEVDLSS